MRIGMGYDVHRLVRERELVLGGVKIPYELGLLGHSWEAWRFLMRRDCWGTRMRMSCYTP